MKLTGSALTVDDGKRCKRKAELRNEAFSIIANDDRMIISSKSWIYMYMFEISLDRFVLSRDSEVSALACKKDCGHLVIRLSIGTVTFPAACFLFFFFSFSFSFSSPFFLFSFKPFHLSSKPYSLRLLGHIDTLLAIRDTESNSKNYRKYAMENGLSR